MKQNKKTWQGTSKKRRNSAFFIFVFLGMLTAFGPFVTDMYLPSLPSMTFYFNASTSLVQLGLTFSMLGLAAGQIVFGPLSDKFGRRKPLLASMILFLVSTLACIFAPTIEIFIALRLLQGIAAAGGIVISRSVATDKFKGANLAKALAIIGAINGVAPVAAPVIGGAVLKVTGWQGIFGVLCAVGVLLTAACIHFNGHGFRPRTGRHGFGTFGRFGLFVRQPGVPAGRDGQHPDFYRDYVCHQRHRLYRLRRVGRPLERIRFRQRRQLRLLNVFSTARIQSSPEGALFCSKIRLTWS